MSTWSRPPREVHRPAVQVDNLALVPASELASLKHWQERACRLPAGSILLVVPNGNLQLRQVGQRIKLHLKRCGHRSLITTTAHRA